MEHFFSPNSGKDQKKSSPKMKHFFPRNSSRDLHTDAHQSQIIGGCRCRPYSNYWRGIYPSIPPGFRHPWQYLNSKRYKLALGGKPKYKIAQTTQTILSTEDFFHKKNLYIYTVLKKNITGQYCQNLELKNADTDEVKT